MYGEEGSSRVKRELTFFFYIKLEYKNESSKTNKY